MATEHPPELIDIYLEELDTRTSALIDGAASLASGDFDFAGAVDLRREAHTLVGTCNMMGDRELGRSAAALERAWKLVDETKMVPGASLPTAMRELAAMMPKVVRDSGLTGILSAAATRVAFLVDTEVEEVDDRAATPSPVRSSTAAPTGPTLGGLLTQVDHELYNTVTRVDSDSLYMLINRAVEIGVEAETLADLTHVVIEGAEPGKVMMAWRRQLERLAAELADLQSRAVALANVPFSEVVGTFPQFTRFLGRRLEREVRLEIAGAKTEADRQVIDLLREPLRHLIVNAIDHGIEPAADRESAGKPATATVRVVAEVVEDRLLVSVSDDGGGIDWPLVERLAARQGLPTSPSELSSHLFRAGFSTVGSLSEFSGTGEGLAVVADAVDLVGGHVSIESVAGSGTTIRLDLPVSLVLQNVVIAATGDEFYGFAEPAVVGTGPLDPESAKDREISYAGESVPLISLAETMGTAAAPETEVMVISTRSGLVAVAVTEVVDRRKIAVRGLGPILEGVGNITGAAFMPGGQALVLVDHHSLGRQARLGQVAEVRKSRILVVDDSAGVRQLIGATLRASGFEVTVASSAREAAQAMAQRRFDALVVDYSMPGSSGVDLVRALRNAGVEQPIVMVSAVADEAGKEEAWQAGVNGYLDKYDLRRGALTEAVTELLKARVP